MIKRPTHNTSRRRAETIRRQAAISMATGHCDWGARDPQSNHSTILVTHRHVHTGKIGKYQAMKVRKSCEYTKSKKMALRQGFATVVVSVVGKKALRTAAEEINARAAQIAKERVEKAIEKARRVDLKMGSAPSKSAALTAEIRALADLPADQIVDQLFERCDAEEICDRASELFDELACSEDE